jgi:undecaprenyl-diphosphatase
MLSRPTPTRSTLIRSTTTRPTTVPRRVPALAAAITGIVALVVLRPDVAGAIVAQAGSTTETAMTVWKAAVLGVVEGVTEYLPISSTGHLLVASDLLGLGTSEADIAAANTYAIAIQFGAILAVAGLFWKRFRDMLLGLVGRSESGRHLLIVLVIAFAPAAVLGFLLDDLIEELLFAPWPIVAAWFVGGVGILALERFGLIPRRGEAPADGEDPLVAITYRQAFIIGMVQTVAMWPGTSRSLMAILGALLVGVGMAAAVEFSFLLGFVTLSAASFYSLASDGGELIDQFGIVDPLVGLLFAFVSAVVAIKWMVGYLQQHSLSIFGWYRIVAASITASLLIAGVINA